MRDQQQKPKVPGGRVAFATANLPLPTPGPQLKPLSERRSQEKKKAAFPVVLVSICAVVVMIAGALFWFGS